MQSEQDHDLTAVYLPAFNCFILGQNNCSRQAAVTRHVDMHRGSQPQPEQSTTAQGPARIPI